MVEIITPGQNKSIPVHEVKDEHKRRWPGAYAAFKRGAEMPVKGTPLETWSYLRPAQVAMLKALNIMCVEDIRDASDSVLEKIGMGAREMQKLATRFLQPAPEREQQIRGELKEAQATILGLQSQIDQMKAAIARKPTDEENDSAIIRPPIPADPPPRAEFKERSTLRMPPKGA